MSPRPPSDTSHRRRARHSSQETMAPRCPNFRCDHDGMLPRRCAARKPKLLHAGKSQIRAREKPLPGQPAFSNPGEHLPAHCRMRSPREPRRRFPAFQQPAGQSWLRTSRRTYNPVHFRDRKTHTSGARLRRAPCAPPPDVQASRRRSRRTCCPPDFPYHKKYNS